MGNEERWHTGLGNRVKEKKKKERKGKINAVHWGLAGRDRETGGSGRTVLQWHSILGSAAGLVGRGGR